MRFIFTLLFLSTTCFLVAQSPPEFSDLSSRTFTQFTSARFAGSIYYCLPSNDGERQIFQVSQGGEVLDSLSLNFDGLIRNGVVHADDGKLLFIGRSTLPFDGTNAIEVWLSQQKNVLELSADLEIISEEFYEVVPIGAGVVVQIANLSTVVMLPEAHTVRNDTLWSVMPFLLSDIENNTILGDQYWFDKVGLDGSIYQNFEMENVGSYYSAAFADENFYVYGDVGGEVIGGGIFDTKPVGQYDLNGDLVAAFEYDDQFTAYFGSGSIGQYHEGRLFSAYVAGYATTEGCPDSSVVIDVRTPEFELIQRFKLPDCDLWVSGRKPFAFTEDGFTYFTVRNYTGSVFLYKFDAEMDLVWSQEYDLPQHFPVSLNLTNDGGVILECIESSNTLRLYKVTGDGDIVSSVKFNQPLEVERYFYPNPFRGEVTLAGPLPADETDLFATDISEKTYGPLAFNGTHADLGFLPAGQYVLSLRAENGRILFSQLAVKVE